MTCCEIGLHVKGKQLCWHLIRLNKNYITNFIYERALAVVLPKPNGIPLSLNFECNIRRLAAC